jgi:hypothetical protein
LENDEVSGPIELLTFTLLPPDEGASLSTEEKQIFNSLLEKNQDIFDVGEKPLLISSTPLILATTTP